MIESIMKLHTCADCSIRCRAQAKPGSLLARLHRWHARWWPGWKIYQAQLRARGNKAMTRICYMAGWFPQISVVRNHPVGCCK